MAKSKSMFAPEFVICCDCETPCYVFDWKDGECTEGTCEVCGNEDESMFLPEEDYEAYANSDHWGYVGR